MESGDDRPAQTQRETPKKPTIVVKNEWNESATEKRGKKHENFQNKLEKFSTFYQ